MVDIALKTERTEIELPADHVCAACPWLVSNHGKRSPDGYYTKANRRRLWNGLRTGAAPGMTCHPTDPENQPVAAHVKTRECAGAMILIARELDAVNKIVAAGNTLADYRKSRRAPLTKQGLLVIANRLMFGRWAGIIGSTISARDDVTHGLD